MVQDNINGVDRARNRIRSGPVPDWVTECPYDRDFKTGQNNHLTYLLWDHQVHAERRETYNHVAMRLETMEAVQNRSQWQVEFEPRTQAIVLHSLKIHREGSEFNQLNLERAHLLQREGGLNHLVIDGCFTFLLVLDDVRVGDILEWAYTSEHNPQILPEYCASFVRLPEWVSIGKYHFTARFDPVRAMKWKSSAAGLKPLESNEQGLMVWKWSAEKYVGQKREPNTPFWYLSAPWIEISDCPDWQTVSAAVAQIWSKQQHGGTLDEWIAEVESVGPDLMARIDKAIGLVQDSCRYLSINLEFGGQIPTPPEVVARRRYGDCKDLSFLLAKLLERLGVKAVPVLVHTGLRKSIGELLPTPRLFDHAIVEFEADGKRRWIDPTMKRQGGGALNRFIQDFGLGLPVDESARGLIEPPQIPGQSNLYQLRETILVDTTGAPSLVSMVVKAEGMQAEILRNDFESKGVEEMSRQSLQKCAGRFGHAKRVGSLSYRDDRLNNQFFTAEVFEIKGFLGAHPDRTRCTFRVPSYWINQTFLLPEKKDRRTPFALPYPYQVVHIIDIESSTLRQMTRHQIDPRLSLRSPFIHFNRTKKTGQRFWTLNFSVNITADSVPADQIEKHREFVGQIWKESACHLLFPVGYARIRQPKDFGKLPDSLTHGAADSSSSSVPVMSDMRTPRADDARPVPVVRPEQMTPSPERRRRHRRQKLHRPAGIPLWLKISGIILAVLVTVVIIAIMGKTVSK